MILLRRLAACLLALFSSSAAGAATPHVDTCAGTYAYDGHRHSAGLADMATDRGPPATQEHDRTYDDGGRWAHGASARPQSAPILVRTTYDPATNTFGSFAPNGMTKTFFKPTSPTYWSWQPGVLQ